MIRTWRFILSHPLGRKHKLASLGRWLRWQLGSRVLNRPVVQPFVNDSVLVVERGMTGATGNIYVGLHEFVEMSFILHFLRPGDLLLDLGANVGSYTVIASAVCGARTLACEPAPTTFQRLLRNVRVNAVEVLVDAREVALGSQPAKLRFTTDRDSMNQVAPPDYPGPCIEATVTTVDALLESVDPPLEEMVWEGDLEGYEAEMLAGAKVTLATSPPAAILIEADTPEVREILNANGFRQTWYDPSTKHLVDTAQSRSSNNQIWIHRSRQEAVIARLSSSQEFLVHGMTV